MFFFSFTLNAVSTGQLCDCYTFVMFHMGLFNYKLAFSIWHVIAGSYSITVWSWSIYTFFNPLTLRGGGVESIHTIFICENNRKELLPTAEFFWKVVLKLFCDSYWPPELFYPTDFS